MHLGLPDPTPPRHNVLWAMDIDEYFNAPTAAHRITGSDGDLVRITACGKRLTPDNHPRGWWSVPPDQLPLDARYIHCGITESHPAEPAHVSQCPECQGRRSHEQLFGEAPPIDRST
jgi:hypothetical protein